MEETIAGFEIEFSVVSRPKDKENELDIKKIIWVSPYVISGTKGERNIKNGLWLTNGGYFYVDMSKFPEIASPECLGDPFMLTAYLEATFGIMRESARICETQLGKKILVFATNEGGALSSESGQNQSLGFHENFLFPEVPVFSDSTMEHLAASILPFMTTRQIIAGSGSFISGAFEISQRPKHTNKGAHHGTVNEKPIVNTKNERLMSINALRLHLTSGDTPILPYSFWLSSGITILVIAAIKGGYLKESESDKMTPTDPVNTFQAISRDPLCRLRFKTNSGETTALDIQRRHLECVGAMLAADTNIPSWTNIIYTAWKDTLNLLSQTPIPLDALEEKIGWVNKLRLLERIAATSGGWQSKAVKTLGVFYHQIDCHTPDFILENRARTRQVVPKNTVAKAMTTPPPTRAANRVAIIKNAAKKNEEVAISWGSVSWRLTKNIPLETKLPSPFLDKNLPH